MIFLHKVQSHRKPRRRFIKFIYELTQPSANVTTRLNKWLSRDWMKRIAFKLLLVFSFKDCIIFYQNDSELFVLGKDAHVQRNTEPHFLYIIYGRLGKVRVGEIINNICGQSKTWVCTVHAYGGKRFPPDASLSCLSNS